MSADTAPTHSTGQSPVVPPADLRHVTSASALAIDGGRRISQHLQPTPRKGSRSPSSIPSSPTSVHSSSSAIFERDIEPAHLSLSPSLSAKKDPHRMPRSKNTETIEQSVPSVLDSAASILTSMVSTEEGDSIAVVAPAPLPAGGLFDQNTLGRRTSGFISPIGSRSRSPSPSLNAGNATSLLLSIPPSSSPPAATSSPTSSSPPNSAPPTARQFSDPAEGVLGATRQAQASKRLSFVSYTDLLSSVPTSTQPLSALTSPSNLPQHISGVSLASAPETLAGSAHGGSGAPSLRNFVFGVDEDRTIDDVGGEWERQGLGKGLEERLEALQSLGMA